MSRKAKDSLVIIVIGVLAAMSFSLLDGDLYNPRRLLGAVIVGLIGSSFIVFIEIWLARPILRQMKFSNLIIFKSTLYTVFFITVILMVVTIERSIEEGISTYKYVQSESFYNLVWKEDMHIMIIYSLAATIGFILVYQISRKMGQGVLWNFIIGKYHHPREEERIFMFMDINNSTSLAEDLGDIEYNKLLSNFFFDITDSIILNYGEIYRYVGDEVVVSWKPKKGIQNAYCIRAFFQAKQAIHFNREKYLNSFGLIPSFSAGFHIGKVIIGEIGEIKSQISFLGNVMYETAEMEKNCKKYQTNNLISGKLLDQIELPSIYHSTKKGIIETIGNTNIQIFSINER